MRLETFIPFLATIFLLNLSLAHPAISHHKGTLKPRQLEEELLQGAEESFELFDFPRVHDSSEQTHEQAERHNITLNEIEDKIREKEGVRESQSRVSVAMAQREGWSYNRQAQSSEGGKGGARIE